MAFYEIADEQSEKLQGRVETWLQRPDLSRFTVERVTKVKGRRAQRQIDEVGSEVLEAIGGPDDVVLRLLDEKNLTVGGTLQVTAHFFAVDPGGDGDDLATGEDPDKREKCTVEISRPESARRGSGKARDGADNLIDAHAGFTDMVIRSFERLEDRYSDRTDSLELLLLHNSDRRHEEFVAHHELQMKQHAAIVRLEHEKSFGTQLARMWEGTPDAAKASLMTTLGEVVAGVVQGWQQSKEQAARRDTLLFEIEHRSRMQAIGGAAVPVWGAGDGSETGPLAVPCRACGTAAGRPCSEAGIAVAPHQERAADLAAALEAHRAAAAGNVSANELE
jgi:hypothetical protein